MGKHSAPEVAVLTGGGGGSGGHLGVTNLTPPTATQVVHPWKSTVRSAFQFIIGLAALIPFIATSLPPVAAIGVVVGVAATITRIMAVPQVNDFLLLHVPWLAADKT